MLKTRHGGCHCGDVRFECEIDLAPEGERSPPPREGVWWTTTFRCNCTFCRKTRMWKVFTTPERFRVTQGEGRLVEYRHGACEIQHVFCGRCGLHPFARAGFEPMGGDFVCVNIACLDDVDPQELEAAPIVYEDGINDAYDVAPRFTGYL